MGISRDIRFIFSNYNKNEKDRLEKLLYEPDSPEWKELKEDMKDLDELLKGRLRQSVCTSTKGEGEREESTAPIPSPIYHGLRYKKAKSD